MPPPPLVFGVLVALAALQVEGPGHAFGTRRAHRLALQRTGVGAGECHVRAGADHVAALRDNNHQGNKYCKGSALDRSARGDT